jgi:hypothetical protein
MECRELAIHYFDQSSIHPSTHQHRLDSFHISMSMVIRTMAIRLIKEGEKYLQWQASVYWRVMAEYQ